MGKYDWLLQEAYKTTGGQGAAFSHDEQGNVYVNSYSSGKVSGRAQFQPEASASSSQSNNFDADRPYDWLLEEAYKTTGGQGSVFEHDDQGNVYIRDIAAEIADRKAKTEAARNAAKPAQSQEDLSIAQRAIDRILGDRTQITGEKTDWRKLLQGTFYKGADQFSTGIANTLDFFAGDLAEELHVLGVESVNQAIDALNLIPGVDLDYVENKGNFLSRWASSLRKGQQQNQEYFAANANSSRAAQIVDKFGTSTVAAIPMALEALILGPTAAAQGAGAEMTTAGLQYTSALAQSSGLSAMSQMGMQGMRNLMKDPQFWTSYLQVMGDGYQDALDQGMSDSDAALYGMVNGFFNAIIEIGGGDDSLGGINRLPAQLREALESGNMNAVVTIAKSMFGEGWEEVQQGIMERGLMQAAQGDSVGEMFSLDPSDTRAAFNPFSAADEFAGGAVVGGLLGGGQSAITSGINRVAGRAAQQQEQTATQQSMPTAQETGTQYVQQVINNMDVPEAAQRVLMDGLDIGDADPQTYAHGIQEAFQLGKMGLTYEQAVDNSKLSDSLTREQFQHAWQIGAQKSGNAAAVEPPTVSRRSAPEYDSIESFSREFASPEKVTEIFDQTTDADVNEFAAGFRAAYDMGRSGVSANYLTAANVPTLTTEQARAAYQLGRTDAEAAAVARDTATAQKQKSGGNQARVRGTVRGEGVTIADLRRSFNDSQNTAYRLLTRYADTTGVNIVLYNSQADSNTGLFPSAQGRFQWKDDTIYVDINSGLFSTRDVNGLGNYTMLRTFAHEFTHFIEKWNAGQYNEFREFVFYTIEQRGENVHDMIEQKQALDESGQMTYEQASREVVADAMMDILPDSTLVQQLAEEHPNVFRTILRKLREFAARLKQYYNGLNGKIREAQAMKEDGAYLESIVKMWDQIAKGAVENYQGANGTEIDAQQMTGKKGKPSKSAISELRAEAKAPTESSKAPETRRAGVDFFRAVEPAPEDAQDVRQQPGVQRVQPASRARFGENDLTSQAEAGPDIRQQAGVQRVAPAKRERFAPNDFTSRAEAGPDMKGMVPRAAERATESETVEEVIEAAEESTEPLEPVPPTEQTEAAKQRLKKGVQTPVQISNTEAIRQGLFRKELTPDNITLTGTVRGLNAEQRAVIIRELLEAYYAGKKETSISVPYDGKFTLSAETEAVAYVIGALKAKVTQDVLFDRKLDAHLKKANPPSTFKLKGNWYISNGFDIIPITDDAAEYAQSNGGYKARITEMQKALEGALDDDYEPLETMPTEITLSNGSQYYRFEIDGKKVFFNKDSLDYLDGGRIGYKRMDITWLSGKTQSMDFIRAVDEDGEVVGYVLATTINPAMRVTKEIPGKLKSFKPGKAKKATKTTPAPAKAEPTPAPTRTTEAQEKTAEAKREAKSRFPLQEWKKGTPSQKAAYRILTEYLRTGKGLPSKDLYAICDEAFGGTQAEGAYNRKDAYDAMELAVNRYILEVMKYYNTGTIDNAAKGVEKALEIVNRLPTQNVRTKEQLEYQQFSTPPSIAYIAAWAANINAQDHVLEPSAGIGGLAAFAKAWGAEVTVNELSERRLEVLRAMGFDHIFNENAEHIHNILPDDIRPTAVIMNPPFSSTAGRTTTNKTSNAEAHINSALDRLAENGRLVAILGRGMADDKYGKYWDRLRKEYTIRANIGIDGENYKKYGTTFDVQIVVIDKVGPQGEARTFTGSYKNLVDAIKALEGTRNDRSAEIERISPVESNPESAAQPAEEQPVSPAMAETNPADSGRAESGDRIDAGRGGESGNADVQRAERGAKPVPDAGARERGAVEQQRPDKKKSGSRKTVEQSEGLRPDAGTAGTAADVHGQSEQQRRGSQSEPARGGQVSADPVTDDGVYTGYRPPDIPIKGSKPHPAVLVESAAMGAVEMPKATYTPKLPDSITKTGALSTEQLVSVTYAGQAHEQKLPNGERRGFFIGDGTGVGKGRTISGIIFDNFEQGRKKAIWISENTKLLPDAIRDWTDISGRGKEDIKDLSTVKLGAKIEKPEGIVFTSYDTVKTKKGNLSRIDQLVDWFGKDFDGVIAFDEAHNMGNLLGKTGARGKSPGSQKAIAAVELQKRLPNARVIYVSATAATEVSGLAFASRLGLWGKGTAFADVNDFVSKIGSAGLSAMELVVRDMKSMGMYVARSISYNGVEYDTIQHDLDPVQRQIYNTMSRAWQNTMRSVEQSLVDTGAQHNSQAKQNAIGQYFNAIQRFYNQVLTSMSMPSVIADMKRQLADGKSCVLQIVNTNQAEADRQIADIKANNGELDDMDLTPRGTLIDYLMKCYPVTKFEEYEDEDGNLRSRPVTNSKGEPVIDKKAAAKRDALIDEVNQMSIPDGPLEMLFDAFGTENVSEITGRTRRVVPRKQADGSIKRVEESRSKSSRVADISAFQNGDKRILVFSAAGGTGASYHADLRAKNQQQRVHYVLQPGWEASKAVQGFGRTHRSNEASAPIYKLVTTDIKGQKRFTSTIARRLDQLGALTKGQRDTGSGMFGASDNLETDLARDSLREFYNRLGKNKLEGIDGRDVLQKLGLLEKFTGEYGEFKMNDTVARDISKFLNRILALEVDEQNRVFDAFISIYEAEMDAAIQAGTLDRGMENVKADKIEIVDDKVIHEQKGTGAATHYVQAKVYTKPKSITTVAEAENLRGGFQGVYRTKDGAIRAVYRIADKTTEWGAVTKQFKLQSPNRSKSSVWQERTLDSNAELLPKSEWQKAWDEEIGKQPEYNEEIKHMLTGSLLPIWDALPEEGNTKVQRLITDDGKAYLGRIISPEQIDNVLRRFDVNRTKETFTGKTLMQKAAGSNVVFNLTYQRAKIHRSRVSGEWRLEYEQPFNAFAVQQQYPDMMMERINYQNRFFIPMNEKGEALLDKLLEANPVSNVVERGEEYSTRQQSISDRDVLRMAAEEINVDSLTPGEQDALRIFNERLNRLQDAQEQRAELGRQYKEQQFTKGGSRAEADRIRAAMSVLDSKIKSLENGLLSLENKDVLKTVLQKARGVVEQEERRRGDESLKRYRERRNQSEATRKYRDRVRAEVETLRKWLVSPSNKDIRKHVPAEIQKTVADFLESINLMSKTALRTSGLDTTKADERYLKNMKKMRDAIKANVDSQGLYSGYADLPADFIENFEALIRKTEQYIGDNSGVFVVNQMSAAELKQLSQTLKTLRKFITTMNMFHNNAVFQHTYDAGEETIEHLTPFEKSKKSGTIYKFLRFDYMRPSYAFEHFGKGGQSIEKEFREGQATQAFLANRIIDFAKKTYTAKEVKTWSETVKSFTLSGGEKISLPITHIMSLYCLNKRAQALTHIYGDGIRVANYTEKGKVQLDEGHLVSLDDVQQMISILSPRQREVADALQKYMSTECATWGNYVSMKRFDVEQFGEENYFPINSDGRYLPATADENPDNSSLYALLNMGFTKELKENANNRIILYNIFDVFANHTASMTQYRSFALPVLDALKWFNYKNDTTSVRTKLSSAFGAPVDERAGSGSKGYAESFVLNLIRAYNGTAAQGDPYDTTMLKMLHRFNGAQIAYNLRVVVQQPTAITRAAMILSPAKLSKGLGMSIVQMRKLAEEMEQHSGIAAWKALGFYDTNISHGLTELIKQNPTVHDQVMDVGTKGAEAADRFTWAAMWYAAKDSVNRSNYSSEEAYMKAVTDLFEEVIYKTQVVDSLLTKSEFLRSKGGLARQLGSFMSEPSATMSMLADAHYKYTDDLQRGMSRSEAWRRNGGNIAKTAAVYAVGQVVLAAMQSVLDAWRDDDEYDSENWLSNYLQKYLHAFKGNIIEELLPFGKIPLVSEIYEATKSLLDYAGVFEKLDLDLYGNDTSSGLTMYMKYLKKAAEIIIDRTGISGNKTNYTTYGAIYNLLRGVSNLSGIPFGTAWREMEDIWNNTVGYFVPNMKLKTYERAADRKKREGFKTFVEGTGLSQSAYNAIYTEADADGDGVEQAEIGPVLLRELERRNITQEQAEAIWNAQGWKTDFQKWASKNGGAAASTATATATTRQSFTPATDGRTLFTPEAAPAGVSDYEGFRSAAPLYGSEKKQAAYGVWESQLSDSMSLDRFTEILVNADIDGNDSLKQDELGYALRSAINRMEMSYGQASAVWNTQGWAHSFDYWSGRH